VLDMALNLIAFLEKNLDYLKLENFNEKMLDVERQLKKAKQLPPRLDLAVWT
jgi:hypothetical protein